MSKQQQATAGIIGLGLIGIYSWIMTGTDGTAADWAWIVLLGAFIVLAGTARAVAVKRNEAHSDR